MKILYCFLMFTFVRSEDTLEYNVRGSDPLVVPLGGSVLLPCSVDKPMQMVKVEWRKTDTESVVHLYYGGDVRSEVQHQDYHDRAHFITDDIKHGNFSILLENVRKEDKGVYRCKVYTERRADKALVEIKEVEYMIVSGSDRSVSAYVGEDVTLNCSVDSHIPPEEIERVSWRKTDKDEDILVLLYQNKTIHPDSSDERFRDRVELFTDDEIHRGNFSLRLKSMRTEDKGLYTCHVFAGQLSANTTVILLPLGFSPSHIMVLILCIAACLSDLLLCCLICRTSINTTSVQIVHLCLYVCSSIFMFLASVFWGTTEASLYETISCCAIHILRLLWIRPYMKDIPGEIGNCIQSSHPDLYSPGVMLAMYSVLLAEHFEDVSSIIMIIICVLLVLLCALFIIQLSRLCEILPSSSKEVHMRMWDKAEKCVATCAFYLLPAIQLGLLLYPHVGYKTVCFAIVWPLLRCMSIGYCWSGADTDKTCWFSFLDKSVWVKMCVMSMIMVPVYNGILRNKNDDVGLVCLAGFLQALWMLMFSEIPESYQKLWNKHVFLFGAVCLVLVNSVILMTDVILQAVKGQRLMVDQRVGVLPSECIFTIPLLFLPIITPWTPVKMKSLQRSKSQDSEENLMHSVEPGVD